jgi:hypothetical protein
MSSVVDESYVSRQFSVILPTNLSPNNTILINEDKNIIDLLTDRLEPSNYIYGNSKSLFQF